MPVEQEIIEALRKVNDPELHRSIVDLKMVRDVRINDGQVAFTLALTVPGCPMKEHMRRASIEALMALPGVKDVQVEFAAMTEEERRAVMGGGAPALPKLNAFNKIGQAIAVMSGKGGVGKSSVTALLATALARSGQKVGIIDADITGPSIPKLFGLPSGGLRGSDQGILPAMTKTGIRVVSTNLLVPTEDTAVIWRGPLITGTIQQFWNEVLWGKLDTMLIDLPPGTSDATITVAKNLPINGVIMVTTPQQLSSLVVRKAVHMLKELNVPVLGVVENMSYFPCPETGHAHYIFGRSHSGEVAEAAGAPLWAQLPIRPEVAELGDNGRIEEAQVPEIEVIAAHLLQPMPVKRG